MTHGPSDAATLLADFVNTHDLEQATDRLDSPAALTGWLREYGLVDARVHAAATDLTAATRLREALRAAMRDHHAGRTEHRELDEELAGYRLRAVLSDGRPRLEPADEGAHAGLGHIVAALIDSVGDHTWDRLKICAEDTCQWAFLDATKNRSRTWCSMSQCGGRAKSRAYRARRRVGLSEP
jgi:predicted RNA-binding Zn ribbon-like protein